jgi:hypothetical protein
MSDENTSAVSPLDHFRAQVARLPGSSAPVAAPLEGGKEDREYPVNEMLHLLTAYVDHLLVRVAELEARLQQAGIAEFDHQLPPSAYDTETGRYKPNES